MAQRLQINLLSLYRVHGWVEIFIASRQFLRLIMIVKTTSKMNFVFLLSLLFSFSCTEQKPEPYVQTGEASYYARLFEGRETASGVPYRKDSLTAAHRTLPMGTIVQVVNLENNLEVTVEINDRGPYAQDRIIDLSRSAAKKIKMIDDGTAEVRLEVVVPAPGYTVSDSVEIE